MQDERNAAFIAGMIIGGILFGIATFIISDYRYNELRKQAIVRHYAVWEVDNSGYTTFKWKEKVEHD
jgi:gas vesicle protein